MVALGLESVLGTDNAASTGNSPALAKTKVRETGDVPSKLEKTRKKKKSEAAILSGSESADDGNRREPARCGPFFAPESASEASPATRPAPSKERKGQCG